ncbi:MAG: phenylacetate--CoA ligase family protein [bacterium]
MASKTSGTRNPYWNMAVETRLNTSEMKELQWTKLKKKLEVLGEGAPFWKERLRRAGTRPADVRSWDDFARRVPILTKEDFREYAAEHGFDMESVLAGWMGEEAGRLRCIAATSGTTGEPTPYPMTRDDLALWTEYSARALWRSGVYPGDKVLHAFGLSMFLAGVPMCISMAEYGACAIPVGAEAGTERVLTYARLFRPSAMLCTPSFAEYMAEKAEEVLGLGANTLSIRTIICGGEPGAGIPAVRRKIESAFNARLYDLGAGLGCSCDYPEYQGMHWLADDLVLLELVNQQTLEPIPLEDGATGLGVFTILDGTALLGIRQTLGDIMEVFTSPCPCGKTGMRYKVIGRTDDMLKVKGVMIYPPAIEGVINRFVPRVTGEFRIVLDEPPPRVVPPLKLKVEYGDVSSGSLELLEQEILEEMHRAVKIRPQITWVPPRTLERFLKKKKLIEKTYEAKE